MTDLDEKLSAYLDGMLEGDDALRIEDLIASDTAVAARLEALALANSDFVQWSEAIDDMPFSAGLAAQMAKLHVDAARADGASNVTALSPRRSVLRFLDTHRAVAAAAAVAAGLIAVQVGMPPPEPATGLPGDNLIFADSRLGEILNSVASGEPAKAGKDVEVTVRFSFASSTGDTCRVTDLASAGGTSRMVACREDAGWRVKVASYGPAPAAGGDDTYQTASGPAGDAIEAYLDAVMAGAPLSLEEEAQLLSRARPGNN